MRKMALVFGLLALVFLVMPSATARFTWQHTFYKGSEVDCTSCHKDVGNELNSGHVHNKSTLGVTSDLEACKVCHIPNIKNDQYNNTYGGATAAYHAAALIECTYCHGMANGSKVRSGTNIPIANITAEFENSNIEAHLPLYKRAMNSSGNDNTDLLKGANEACIACHTATANVTIVGEYSNLTIIADLNNSCTGSEPGCYQSNGGITTWWNITMIATR